MHLRKGDLDTALSTWTAFLDCADGIRSVKIAEAANDMHVRLDRYGRLPEVEEVRRRAEPLLSVRDA